MWVVKSVGGEGYGGRVGVAWSRVGKGWGGRVRTVAGGSDEGRD